MALAINSKLVDENTLRGFFRGIVLTHVEKFYPWIKRRREIANSEKVFQSITELYERWQNGDGKQI
ncbi:MAG: DUF4760 domain-containing protein [Leptolyngbyaceae cyanobacterium RM1_405_57]|nr:DUF4760 domain-containing protein [Leptolyngbyaceae cyanobacterium RM1_405_57]